MYCGQRSYINKAELKWIGLSVSDYPSPTLRMWACRPWIPYTRKTNHIFKERNRLPSWICQCCRTKEEKGDRLSPLRVKCFIGPRGNMVRNDTTHPIIRDQTLGKNSQKSVGNESGMQCISFLTSCLKDIPAFRIETEQTHQLQKRLYSIGQVLLSCTLNPNSPTGFRQLIPVDCTPVLLASADNH